MSDKKISQLTAATTPLAGTEEIAIVQGGSTVKATAQDVADLAGLPYTTYVALIDYSGAGNPTVTVFENNTGKLFNWVEDFIYNGVSATVASTNYLNCYMQASNDINAPSYNRIDVLNSSGSALFLISNLAGSNFKAFVEIRIYP